MKYHGTQQLNININTIWKKDYRILKVLTVRKAALTNRRIHDRKDVKVEAKKVNKLFKTSQWTTSTKGTMGELNQRIWMNKIKQKMHYSFVCCGLFFGVADGMPLEKK